MASTGRSSHGSIVKGTAELFQSKWPRTFFLVALFQAALCIGFEGYVFVKFNSAVKDIESLGLERARYEDAKSQPKTILTFLSLFIFGFLYDLILVWDGLRMKNTIQVIGVCVANLALLIYTAIQIDQIKEAVDILALNDAISHPDMWPDIKPLLIAIPGVIALCSLVLSFLAWRLYQEFAWDILKHIGADYRMKKRFLHYQIYIALLKFDFFFFIGFTVQFLVVVGGKTDIEFALTCVAIPVTIGILLAAAFFTRNEWKWGMVLTIALYLGGLAYFIFKLARIYDAKHWMYYLAVRKSLTAFTVLTIILIVMTIMNAVVCMSNFDHGLKQHLTASRKDVDKDQVSYSMTDIKPAQAPSRMTID